MEEVTFSPLPPLPTEQIITAAINTNTLIEPSRNTGPLREKSDFIPDEILLALTKPEQVSRVDKLGPPSRYKQPKGSPANVWNHADQRKKLKHLTDRPPCVCGAGRDVSFLCDVGAVKQLVSTPPLSNSDNSQPRKLAIDQLNKDKKTFVLPDTLLPEEYHIVKCKGVLGLEYYTDKYTTQTDDHTKHLTTFPSMKPNSRYEVARLKEVMCQMLDEILTDNKHTDTDTNSQMHNLLELVKKEQSVYNLIFHELIRQVSVECNERGELLAHLRQKYAELLDNVPRHVKSLHSEVMAQRALDRRLTEELLRFKNSIRSLTSELTQCREHDQSVTEQSQQAKEDLKAALLESEKNASLLAEYHDLYELQRQRLERQVSILTDERELWCRAAYSLSLKVTEVNKLNTAKQLHMNEKSWCKLTNHYTVLLADRDTLQMTKLQQHVDTWRHQVEEFQCELTVSDLQSHRNMKNIHSAIHRWMDEFDVNIIVSDRSVRSPNVLTVTRIKDEMKKWQEILGKECERYSGDILLACQEKMIAIGRSSRGWTDVGLRVFNRHRGEDGSHYPDHNTMIEINELVDALMKQYHIQINGENGAARCLIHVTNEMESWDTKLSSVVDGGVSLTDSDWVKFRDGLKEWAAMLDETDYYIGRTERLEDLQAGLVAPQISLNDVLRRLHKWVSSSTNGIDAEDTRLQAQVTQLHKNMIQWMVQVLLRLCPDQVGNTQYSHSENQLSSTLSQIQDTVLKLSDKLRQFSIHITNCCSGAIMDVDSFRPGMDTDSEYRDLKKVKIECNNWIHTAQLLLSEITGELPLALEGAESGTDVTTTTTDSDEVGPMTSDVTMVKSGEEPITAVFEGDVVTPLSEGQGGSLVTDTQQEQPSTTTTTEPGGVELSAPLTADTDTVPVTDELKVIGHDGNVHNIPIDQAARDTPVSTQRLIDTTQIGSDTNPSRALEAIAAVQALQTQLLATEERAQQTEEKCRQADEHLIEAEERIRQLERALTTAQQQVEVSTAAAANTKESTTADTKLDTPTGASSPTKRRASHVKPTSTHKQPTSSPSPRPSPTTQQKPSSSIKKK